MTAMNPENFQRRTGQSPTHFLDRPIDDGQRSRIRDYLQRLGRDESSLAVVCGDGYVNVDSLSCAAADSVIFHLSQQLRLVGSIGRKAVLERDGRLDLWDAT